MKSLAAVRSAFLVLAARQTRAGIEEGVTAYKRGHYATAFREWRPLAEQGNAVAQHNFGVMYGNGKGVPRDYVQAHKWFILSAAQGDAKAQECQELTAGVMTPAQIAEAQRLAIEWTEKHQK